MSYISTIDVASRFGLWNHFGSKSETGEEEDKFDLNAGSADEESFQENSEHENKAIFQDSTFMNEDGGFDYDTFTENFVSEYGEFAAQDITNEDGSINFSKVKDYFMSPEEIIMKDTKSIDKSGKYSTYMSNFMQARAKPISSGIKSSSIIFDLNT